MTRTLTPELLDALPPDDPRAIGSRRDLARINALMGNARLVAGALAGSRPARVLELGAGDGREALRWARRLPRGAARITLLDLQPVVPPSIVEGFERLGWTCEVVAADALVYLSGSEGRWGAVVSNLFAHHFEGAALSDLLGRVAERCELFVACEPARSPLALAGTRALGLLGCNVVTRHDARVSVEAGFREREISALWPDDVSWDLQERDAFPFSHLFRAERRR